MWTHDLVALVEKAKRLLYLNSGMYRGTDVSPQDITARLQSPRNVAARGRACAAGPLWHRQGETHPSASRLRTMEYTPSRRPLDLRVKSARWRY
jgi:hypothetical protein